MPLIQSMALIQFNITLDINYAFKTKDMHACISTVSLATIFVSRFVLLNFVFWQYGSDPW